MKFTCLSEGKGYHFPPCHLLNICGFQLLFDCPLDLSALSVFSPLPITLSGIPDEYTSACSCETSSDLEHGSRKEKIEKPLDASSLIHAEPWYKTVKSLKLWNISFIDIVLISSPMGILGLPFLTRSKEFSAKVYATEATARLGQLMMEDLVKMHNEIKQFYGPEDSSCPEWMKWDEIELLPPALKEILTGGDGGDLGGWMPLYNAADVTDCMQKVQYLKYAEEACYNGTLLIKAFSSGLDIGTCNWSIASPEQNIAYLSSSTFASATATKFDCSALQGSDVIFFSDFTASDVIKKHEDDYNGFRPVDKNLSSLSRKDDDGESITEFLLNTDEFAEDLEKLAFLCSCSLDSVKAGGSVLIPIAQLGIVLQLLEHIAFSLQSWDMKVPIFIISSVAEELFSFLSVIPEWLCKERQDKFYSGQPLFAFMDLINEERLFLIPVIHSPKLLSVWQEPCIVFCPHWSLRIGPAVHLLHRWCGDENSLLVMEEGLDANLTFLPFRQMAIKILQCSFISGTKLQKAESLLKLLKPKYVLFPEKLKQDGSCLNRSSSCIYYSENKTLKVPKLKDCSEVDIAIDLACQLCYTKLDEEDVSIARTKGELFVEQGKNRLLCGNDRSSSSQTRPMLYLGGVDLQNLLTTLQSIGMSTRVEVVVAADGLDLTFVHVLEPKRALIEVTAARTIVCTDDENLSSVISKAICSILNVI